MYTYVLLATIFICIAFNQASHLIRVAGTGNRELNLPCQDEYSAKTCVQAVEKNICKDKQALTTLACRQSCGLCNAGEVYAFKMTEAGDSRQGQGRASSCVDQFPDCSVAGSGPTQNAICCMSVEFMNRTCAKTCKFCSVWSAGMPIQGIPGMPIPGGGPAPTVVTQQNPCDPTSGNTPSAGVNPGR